MKPLLFSFALVAMTSAMSCTAQTGQSPTGADKVRFVPGNTSPQQMQALTTYLFEHTIRGHGLQTPQEKAKMEAIRTRLNEMERTASEALHSGDFPAAEAAYRSLIETNPFSTESHYGLGDALAGQGRVADAIAAYRVGIYMPLNAEKSLNDIPLTEPSRGKLTGCQNQTVAASWMRCALLLSQSGQAAEAVVIYNQALPRVSGLSESRLNPSLDSDAPALETLQAAAHVALGLCITFDSTPDHERAMSEFNAARRLRPDSPLTNYYYGYGWQRLDPKGIARRANAAQAKAAFQQAAAYGNNDVKKAAEHALTGFK